MSPSRVRTRMARGISVKLFGHNQARAATMGTATARNLTDEMERLSAVFYFILEAIVSR
jgi:hypothetical protein